MIRFKQYLEEAAPYSYFRTWAGSALPFFRIKNAIGLKEVLHRYGGVLRGFVHEKCIDCWDGEHGLHADYEMGENIKSGGIPVYIVQAAQLEISVANPADLADLQRHPMIKKIAPQAQILKI